MSLEHVLLALISEHSSTGYELKKRIDRELDPFWRAELSQIYPSLSKLRSAGFVRLKVLGPDRGPGRNRYRITPRGIIELARWRREPARPPDLRDESMIRLRLSEGGAGFAEARRAYDRALSDEIYRLRRRPAAGALAEKARLAGLARLEAARRFLRATFSSARGGRASRRP